MAEANRTTSVYLYFDSQNVLIYVGITGRGIARQREHERDKPWWPHVARQEIEHYPTRGAASDRERSLIALFSPPFNTVHTSDATTRDAYLVMAEAALSPSAAAPGKRVHMRIVSATDDALIALSDIADAAVTAPIDISGPFVIAAARRRARAEVRKVGTAIALSVKVPGAQDFTSVSLMYKHAAAGGRFIKRIDMEEAMSR